MFIAESNMKNESLHLEIADLLYRLETHQALLLLNKFMEESQEMLLNQTRVSLSQEQLDELQGFMEIMFKALEQKDYILLADLLRYEWDNYVGVALGRNAIGERI